MKLLILLALAGVAATLCFHSPRETDEQEHAEGLVAWQSEQAMLLFQRGRLAEAKKAFWRARLAFTRLLGPRDPATLNCRNNFAAVLHAMGDFSGAEAANRAALALCEQALGRRHPDALASRRNLAVTLLSEGKLEDALNHARRVEAGTRRAFGADRPEYEQAVRLKECIEDAMESSKRNEKMPRGGPSGLRGRATGVA
jgi:tetratricopeptide (TPR) repeat protein